MKKFVFFFFIFLGLFIGITFFLFSSPEEPITWIAPTNHDIPDSICFLIDMHHCSPLHFDALLSLLLSLCPPLREEQTPPPPRIHFYILVNHYCHAIVEKDESFSFSQQIEKVKNALPQHIRIVFDTDLDLPLVRSAGEVNDEQYYQNLVSEALSSFDNMTEKERAKVLHKVELQAEQKAWARKRLRARSSQKSGHTQLSVDPLALLQTLSRSLERFPSFKWLVRLSIEHFPVVQAHTLHNQFLHQLPDDVALIMSFHRRQHDGALVPRCQSDNMFVAHRAFVEFLAHSQTLALSQGLLEMYCNDEEDPTEFFLPLALNVFEKSGTSQFSLNMDLVYRPTVLRQAPPPKHFHRHESLRSRRAKRLSRNHQNNDQHHQNNDRKHQPSRASDRGEHCWYTDFFSFDAYHQQMQTQPALFVHPLQVSDYHTRIHIMNALGVDHPSTTQQVSDEHSWSQQKKQILADFNQVEISLERGIEQKRKLQKKNEHNEKRAEDLSKLVAQQFQEQTAKVKKSANYKNMSLFIIAFIGCVVVMLAAIYCFYAE